MRTRTLVGVIATVTVLASGCAAGGSARAPFPSAATHSTPTDMPGRAGMSMAVMPAGEQPSTSARMICGAEIRHAVERTFALSEPPASTHSWADQLFSCTYALPQGSLLLAVKDSRDTAAGRAYFNGLRSRLAGAATIHGAEAFGFPAFQVPDGNVVFLKDGKTLRVDASALPRQALPNGLTREETAYGVAAAVIGCWTE